jgi:hypothetical protein
MGRTGKRESLAHAEARCTEGLSQQRLASGMKRSWLANFGKELSVVSTDTPLTNFVMLIE